MSDVCKRYLSKAIYRLSVLVSQSRARGADYITTVRLTPISRILFMSNHLCNVSTRMFNTQFTSVSQAGFVFSLRGTGTRRACVE